MNKSCHTYEWVMSHIRMTWFVYAARHTCECVVSHVWILVVQYMWISRVTLMNESCPTYEWRDSCECVTSHISIIRDVSYMGWSCTVAQHIRITGVTLMNESCPTYEWVGIFSFTVVYHRYESDESYQWVVSRLLMYHVPPENESRDTCEWASHCIYVCTSQMRASRVTHVNMTRCTCELVVLHMWIWHVAHVNWSCYTCEYDMLHMWIRRVSHVRLSYHKCEWVLTCEIAMQDVWTSHSTFVDEVCDTRMNEAWYSYEWVMAHI